MMIRFILILALIMAPAVARGQLIRNDKVDSLQVETLQSLKKISENLFTMNYRADYCFEEFKASGVGELKMEGFVKKYLDTIPAPNLWSCSAFMVKNNNNEVLVGRNFDWENIPGLILFTEPENGYKSISLVPADLMIDNKGSATKENKKLLWSPYFPVEGMNERGLVVIELAVEGEEVYSENKVSLLSLQLIRLLLDNALDLNESIKLLEEYNNVASNRTHFFIADSTGNSAVIEYFDNELQITRNKEHWQAVSNAIVYKNSDKKLRKLCGRYNFMSQYLSAHSNAISSVGALNLLRSVSVNQVYSSQFNITSSTQWSVVYNIGERCIDIVSRRDFRNRYHYDLKLK